jgi:hypothetical protein
MFINSQTLDRVPTADLIFPFENIVSYLFLREM